jgi:hypothetical protein
MNSTDIEHQDESLAALADASLPIRAISRAGAVLAAAWRSSAPGRLGSRWTDRPLGRRIRLTATTIAAAIVTHVTLTGFRAPEPTWAARSAWVALLIATAAVSVCSESVATAWATWTRPRWLASDRENS